MREGYDNLFSMKTLLKGFSKKAQRNYTIQIERDEDGVFVGEIPDLPACYTQANNIPDLLSRLLEVAEGSAQIFVKNVSEAKALPHLKFSLQIHATA